MNDWIKTVPFISLEYNLMLAALAFGRGMDLLSTWIASPKLLVEANPIVRRLGWRWGIAANLALCLLVAFYPMFAVFAVTLSVLVAARNFRTAWMVRAMGEDRYLVFILNQLSVANRRLVAFCLIAECLLFGAIGLVIVFGSKTDSLPFAVGMGILGYAVAVAFFSCLSLGRSRRGADE